MKIDFNNLFIMGGEIPMCPFCGSRTSILLDLSHIKNGLQVHQCLFKKDTHQFVLIEN